LPRPAASFGRWVVIAQIRANRFFSVDVTSVFQGLVGENIFSLQIQARGRSVDALQIARMNFSAGSLPKMESKDAFNNF